MNIHIRKLYRQLYNGDAIDSIVCYMKQAGVFQASEPDATGHRTMLVRYQHWFMIDLWIAKFEFYVRGRWVVAPADVVEAQNAAAQQQ